jgi:hypothetical protein
MHEGCKKTSKNMVLVSADTSRLTHFIKCKKIAVNNVVLSAADATPTMNFKKENVHFYSYGILLILLFVVFTRCGCLQVLAFGPLTLTLKCTMSMKELYRRQTQLLRNLTTSNSAVMKDGSSFRISPRSSVTRFFC